MMIFNYLLLIVGFALLIKGANWLVEGSASIAGRLGISTLVIGLTIVAFGTSAPELVVNVIAGYKGNVDIAIGNILGSNIANIFLILGVAGVIYPLRVQKSTTYKEIPMALLAAIVLAVMANDAVFDSLGFSTLTRTDGITLIGFFAIFLYYAYSISKNGTDNEAEVKKLSASKSALMIIGGIAGLALGGQWIVSSASKIAAGLGASEALIGLTIVAVGTSLPELATSVSAALKKHSDIAVGNIVGSNIFNIFWILGISSIIRPLPFTPAMNFDIAVVLLATLMLFLLMFVGKKHILQRYQAGIFLFLYVAYIACLIIRG